MFKLKLFSAFHRLSASSRIAHLLPEEQVYLNQQSGTIRLDCFTHCLIVKCAPDITVSPSSLSSSPQYAQYKLTSAFYFKINVQNVILVVRLEALSLVLMILEVCE